MTLPSWEDPRVRQGLPRQFSLRHGLLESGATAVGWKVGFGAPASLELMRISAPLLGFLTGATLIESGSRVDTAGWERGIVEFEVAVYLGKDLGAGATNAEAHAAICGVGAAIELANIDLPVDSAQVTEIVAGNIFHKAVVLGEPDTSRSGLDITGLTAHIAVDGLEMAVTSDLEALTGAYPWIVSTVADTLAASGLLLREGDAIITGSVIAPIPVGAGAEFTFVLDPLEPLSVTVG